MPTLVMSTALLGSYYLGSNSGVVDFETGLPIGGLFGTAVATMGMLSSACFVLTMDFFGPISDNAGGIVEMASEPSSVREVTDLLDTVGNTTKAATKGFAVGSGFLACFLLFSAFMDEVEAFTSEEFRVVDIAVPEVFVGGALGSTLVMVFTSWTLLAVGRSAEKLVEEVRRQFRDEPGILKGTCVVCRRSVFIIHYYFFSLPTNSEQLTRINHPLEARRINNNNNNNNSNTGTTQKNFKRS